MLSIVINISKLKGNKKYTFAAVVDYSYQLKMRTLPNS